MGRDAVLWCVSTVCPWLLYVTLFFLIGISEVFREVDWDVFVEDYPISSIIPLGLGGVGGMYPGGTGVSSPDSLPLSV